MIEGPAERLRIIVGQADQRRHHPVFVEIIRRARSIGMAGATALGGVAGYGASSRVHRRHTLPLSADTPVVVIVDRHERIDHFAAGLDEVIAGGLVVRQPVEIVGASSRLHTSRILSMSDDLPMVIEIVDRDDRIRAILPRLELMTGDGLITLEDLQVWRYRAVPGDALDDGEAPPRQ